MPFTSAFHHLGVLCHQAEAPSRSFVLTFGYTPDGPVLELPGLDIRVRSLSASGKPAVELIQPLKADSSLGRMLAAGTTGYHLAWSVPDLDHALAQSVHDGFHALPVFTSPLWNGARCAFILDEARTLFELIENPPQENR